MREAEMGYRVCTECRGRGTKIVNASRGEVLCQDCGNTYPLMKYLYKTDEDHAEALVNTIAEELDAKYEAGMAEHGGHLWRKPLLGHAIDEVLDLAAYLYTLRDQMEEVFVRLSGPYTEQKWREARNIMQYGNPEGVEEPENGVVPLRPLETNMGYLGHQEVFVHRDIDGDYDDELSDAAWLSGIEP